MSNKLVVDQGTGHLTDCYVGIAFPSEKRCSGTCADGTPCGRIPVRHSCLDGDTPDSLAALCAAHWSDECDRHGWDMDLSSCANRLCDAKKISIRRRHEIVPSNIRTLLGLQPLAEHFSTIRHRQIRMIQKEALAKSARTMADAEKRSENLRILHTIGAQHLFEPEFEPEFDPGSYQEDSFVEKDESSDD